MLIGASHASPLDSLLLKDGFRRIKIHDRQSYFDMSETIVFTPSPEALDEIRIKSSAYFKEIFAEEIRNLPEDNPHKEAWKRHRGIE